MRISLLKPSKAFAYLASLLLAAGVAGVSSGQHSGNSKRNTLSLQPAVNVGFSPGMFSGVEKEDVVSALKIWGDSVLENRGVHLGSMPRIYNSHAEMQGALRDGKVDFLALLSVDYLALEKEADLGSLLFSTINGSTAEEYVLLIHRESGIGNLADLQDKSIIIQTGFRANLAPIWLDILLMQQGFDDAGQYFSTVELKENPLMSILPVFFGNVDACLVPHSSIDSMVEMNPQISQRLRILMSSEKLVPSLFCIRADYNPLLKNEFLSALHTMELSPAGQQVLRMFGAEKLVSGQAGDLKNTRHLLETYLNLKTERTDP